MTENWKGDADGILIFVRARLYQRIFPDFFQTGLFAATVATFFVDSYKTMLPDPAAATVVLLAHLSQQISAVANGSASTPSPLPIDPSLFNQSPSRSSTRVNVLWSLSLVLSLICALMATLVQQWSRRYLGRTKRRLAPSKRARLRAQLVKGVETFRMSAFVNAIPALLHTSVLLFLAGFIEYQLSINHVVAYVVLSLTAILGAVYIALSISPFVRLNCPYQTPLSNPLRILCRLPFRLPLRIHFPLLLSLAPYNPQFSVRYPGLTWRVLSRCYAFLSNREGFRVFEWFERYSRRFSEQDVLDRHLAQPSALDVDALLWVVDSLDDDCEFEHFVSGIPDFLDNEPEEAPKTLARIASQAFLVSRIVKLAETCKDRAGLYTPSKRFFSCSQALLRFVTVPGAIHHRMEECLNIMAQSDLVDVWDSLRPLLTSGDGEVTSGARAGIALAVQNSIDSSGTDQLEFLVSCIRPPPLLADPIIRMVRRDRHILPVVNLISFLSGIERHKMFLSQMLRYDPSTTAIVNLWHKLPWSSPESLDLSDDACGVALAYVDAVLTVFRKDRPTTVSTYLVEGFGSWYYTLLAILWALRASLHQPSSVDAPSYTYDALFSDEDTVYIDRDFLRRLGVTIKS